MTSLVTPISHLFQTDELTNEICTLSTSLEARERTSKLRLPKTTHYHIDFDLNIGLTEDNINFLKNEVKDRQGIHTLTFRYQGIVKKYKSKKDVLSRVGTTRRKDTDRKF